MFLKYQGREWRRDVGPHGLVTVIEAAALLEMSRAGLYQWINMGRVRPIVVSRGRSRPTVMIRLGEVKRLMTAMGRERG